MKRPAAIAFVLPVLLAGVDSASTVARVETEVPPFSPEQGGRR